MSVVDDIFPEAPMKVRVGDDILTLSPQAASKLEKTYCSDYKNYVKELRRSFDEKNTALQKLLDQAITPPPWDYVHKHEITVGKHNGGLRFTLPFRYAPTSLGGKRILHPEQLVRDILIAFDLTGGTRPKIQKLHLLNPDLTEFKHYHYFDSAEHCWGSYKYNPHVSDISDLVNIRNGIEHLLSNINFTREHPQVRKVDLGGLPRVESIQVSSDRSVWRPKDLKQAAPAGRMEVGALEPEDTVWRLNRGTAPAPARVTYAAHAEPRRRHAFREWWATWGESLLILLAILTILGAMVSVIVHHPGLTPQYTEPSVPIEVREAPLPDLLNNDILTLPSPTPPAEEVAAEEELEGELWASVEEEEDPAWTSLMYLIVVLMGALAFFMGKIRNM